MQFRLQQVVSAPTDKREDLLKDLESFAFRGIPNINLPLIVNECERVEEVPNKRDEKAEVSSILLFNLFTLYTSALSATKTLDRIGHSFMCLFPSSLNTDTFENIDQDIFLNLKREDLQEG